MLAHRGASFASQLRCCYQRSPPSPPPPPPPRGPRPPPPPPPPPPPWRSCASLIRRGRPPISLPFKDWMARCASLLDISTKPKPRGRPVSRSLISATDCTAPCCSKSARTS